MKLELASSAGISDITGQTPSQNPALTVKAGQKIILTLTVAPSAIQAETLIYSYLVPGDVIADYQPTAGVDGPALPESKLTGYDCAEGTTDPSTAFLWVDPPSNGVVMGRVFSISGRLVGDASATFKVSEPTYNLTPLSLTPGPGTVNVRGTYITAVGTHGVLSAYAGVQGTAQGGWEYCFAQTIRNFFWDFDVPQPRVGSLAPGTYVSTSPDAGLDVGFPFGPRFSSQAPSQSVSVWWRDPPSVPIYQGGDNLGTASHSYYSAILTVWLLARPVTPGGIVDGDWVPVANMQWAWLVSARWPKTDNLPALDASAFLSGNFAATTDFPTWTAIINTHKQYKRI